MWETKTLSFDMRDFLRYITSLSTYKVFKNFTPFPRCVRFYFENLLPSLNTLSNVRRRRLPPFIFVCNELLVADFNQPSSEHGTRRLRDSHRMARQRLHHRLSVLAQRLQTEARFPAAYHVVRGRTKRLSSLEGSFEKIQQQVCQVATSLSRLHDFNTSLSNFFGVIYKFDHNLKQLREIY